MAVVNLDRKFACWFGWPWNDARNAAAFACELIRSVVPPSAVSKAATEKGPEDSAENIEGPYRQAYVEVKNIESTEVFDARCLIDHVLAAVEDYARGSTPVAPASYESPYDDPKSRLYWWARDIGVRARDAAGIASVSVRPMTPASRIISVEAQMIGVRWRIAGRATAHLTEFLQKYAVGNFVVGAPDGLGNAILRRVAQEMITALDLPEVEVERRVLDWRIRDGLKDRVIDAETRENLRLAFEAAWMIGEYQFGYSLLEGLESVSI